MSSESTVNICIKDVAGNTSDIAMTLNETVRTLKEKYSELHTDISVGQQKLLIISSDNSRVLLQNNNMLSSYNISENGIGSRENPVLIFIFKLK